MKPKFEPQQCQSCSFYGHWAGHDVWVCQGGDPSLIARFGNRPSDYASCPIGHFKDLIRDNSRIGLLNGKSLPFCEYLASEHCSPYHRAWQVVLCSILSNLD